jgi:hypothetical protein
MQMSRRVIVVIAMLLLIASPVLAFKPWVHKDITKRALQATSKTVGSQTYKFTNKAIDEILKANTDTDCLSCQAHAEYHFDDEDFAVASQRLVDLKINVLQDLSGSSPDGKKARQHLGTALHTLQDFYAHSTRVELGQSSFDGMLGVQSFVGPAANVAVCPNDAGVRAGAGLTTVTSGYFQIPLCDPPAGKCRHGIPIACSAGLNKDEPGRPNYQAAYDLALTQTQHYINDLILNDSSITNNGKAVRALMGITQTLGMVVDTTGSMGDVIGSVQSRINGIVNGVVGTPDEPDQYLLEPFNDPFWGPPTVTGDAPTFLAQVNALFASGGGDCPEFSMSGMLQALNAVDPQSTLYLFTDASAKDSSLFPSVITTASQKNVTIKYGLFGSCSPIDPAFIATAQATGGQVFFLNRFFETSSLFDLVASEIGPAQVTIAHQSGQLVTGARDVPFPVDSAMSSLTVTVSVDFLSSVTLTRPDGTIVSPGDADASVTNLSVGAIYVIHPAQTGNWDLQIQGSGAYSADIKGKTTRDLLSPFPDLHNFNFVTLTGRVAHEGYFNIQGQPVVSDPQIVVANLDGTVSNVSFNFVSDSGDVLQPAALAQGDPNAAPDDFVGTPTLPSVPFRLMASGLDASGAAFQRTDVPLIRPQAVRVTPTTIVDGLPQGQTVLLNFQIQNLGVAGTFNVSVQDSAGFFPSISQSSVTLDMGATATVTASVNVPLFVTLGTTDAITVLATSAADPNFGNSAVQSLNVQPAFGFNGGGQRPTDVNLFLTYAIPTSSPVSLPTGTSSFLVMIAYSANTIPTTFSATLNGVNISSQFHPQPGTFETVTVSLQSGRNDLLISIDGNRTDGHVATDRDRLVFNVQ